MNRTSMRKLLLEANSDPMMNPAGKAIPVEILQTLKQKAVPIRLKNNLVGFYMMGKDRTGRVSMDNIYIKQSERHKGHAYRLASKMIKENPDLVWSANAGNIPSVNLAKKVGVKNLLLKGERMNKQAYLEEAYRSGYEGELEKVAASGEKYLSALAKRLSPTNPKAAEAVRHALSMMPKGLRINTAAAKAYTDLLPFRIPKNANIIK